MLFSFQESGVQNILEEYKKGIVEAKNALRSLVCDSEVLQELKRRDEELINFLAANVAGLVATIADGSDEEAQTAVEILCSEHEEISRGLTHHLDAVFEGLLKERRREGAFERVAAVVSRRHRASLVKWVPPALFKDLAQHVERQCVARTLSLVFGCAVRPLRVDSTILVGRLGDPSATEAAAASVLLGLFKRNPPPPEIILEVLDVVDPAEDPEEEARAAAAFDVAISLIPRASDRHLDHLAPRLCDLLRLRPRVGAHGVKAAAFVADVLRTRPSLDYDKPLAAAIDLFFAFPDHSLLHRVVATCLIDVVRIDPDAALRFALLDRLPKAVLSPLPTSLKAHAILVCEALAAALYAALPINPAFRPVAVVRDAPPPPPMRKQDDLMLFLDFLALVVSTETANKQPPLPDSEAGGPGTAPAGTRVS